MQVLGTRTAAAMFLLIMPGQDKAGTTWLVVLVDEQVSIVATPERYLEAFSLKYRNGPQHGLPEESLHLSTAGLSDQ